LPETIKIAKAYGLKTFKITNQIRIGEKVKAVLDYPGPAVCEIMIKPDLLTQPRVSSQVMSDGKIISKPMEDLWPFLPRKEFKANMIIETTE